MLYRKHIIQTPKKTSIQLLEIMSRAEVIPASSSPNKEIKNAMWSSSTQQSLTVLKEAGCVRAQTLSFLIRAYKNYMVYIHDIFLKLFQCGVITLSILNLHVFLLNEK